MAGIVVLDASAMVDLLIGAANAHRIGRRIDGQDLHVPAHFDAEILSALGRLHRAGRLTADQVSERLDSVVEAGIERHPIAPLLTGAWSRRTAHQLADALYVELADRLGCPLLTTDRRLAAASPVAEYIESAE